MNFMTFHILGMSSSQLTPHIFRGVAQPPIRRCLWPDLLGKLDILCKWYWSTHCINLSHFWPTAASFLKSVTFRRRASQSTGFRTMRSGSTSRTQGNYAPTLWTILLVRFTQGMDGTGGCWDYYSHDGSMVLLYMVCHGSHQYTPFMLAYIPAPWMIWDW